VILPIHKILCPTDFSSPSYDGLEAAVELARHFDAELIVLHVVSPAPIMPGSFSGAGSYLPTVLEEVEDWAKNSLQALLEKRVPKEIRTQGKVVIGTPAMEIAQMAVAEKADITVIATHGESGWKKFLMGSVTERVVRLAERPVLTIHARDDEEKEEEEK